MNTKAKRRAKEMKYYSTKLNRLFETVKELEAAEKVYDDKQKEAEKVKAERTEAAKKVEEAYKLADETKKAADQLLTEFCKKYGPYHKTITKPDSSVSFIEFVDKFPFWF